MDYLFNSYDLSEVLRQKVGELREEINRLAEDYVLGVSETDLVTHLKGKYSVDPVSLGEPFISSSQEINIDVSRDPLRRNPSHSGPTYAKGVGIHIHVPYTGDMLLFRCRPASFTFSPPQASVTQNHLDFQFAGERLAGEQVKAQLEGTLRQIRGSLNQIEVACKAHNASLEAVIRQVFTKRKERLLANRQLVASIGLPIQQRSNALKTYVVPDVRRKPDLNPPVVKDKAFVPEPALAEQEYENILSIIRGMVSVMERSPRAFADMGEEDLRTHFLVQLNGQYQGRATGETFNFQGKTDILIREGDRNVFIAECKIWKGEGELVKAINQILSYLHWRDTKTALMVFNRNKSFSDVLAKIEPAVQSHKCCKRLIKKVSETEWRFLFHNPDDSNRELQLAVMLFDIPKEAA